VNLVLPARPLRFDLDPEFDLFRRLDRREIPPALSQAFGAKKILILLPSSAPPDRVRAYRSLAELLSRAGPGEVEIESDAERYRLPHDRSVWLLGWENLFLGEVRKALAPYGASVGFDGVRIGSESFGRAGHPAALAVRHPDNEDLALLWIGADNPFAILGLARKLPHYHRYSYLVFEGAEPSNIAKGSWTLSDTPMSIHLPGEDGEISRVPMGRLVPRTPLTDIGPQAPAQGPGPAGSGGTQ
jgi:hypothetical protein